MKKKISIILSALVLALGVVVIFNKLNNKTNSDNKKVNMHEASVIDTGSGKRIDLYEKNERAVIDDKLTIEFYGVENSTDIYAYTAKIYYNGKLIEDNVFTDSDNRIIRHSAAQIGGLFVTKVNNVYFINSVISSPTSGSAVLVLNNGNIINSFMKVFSEIDANNNTLVLYDATTFDKDEFNEDNSKIYYEYCESTKYNILENNIELINN